MLGTPPAFILSQDQTLNDILSYLAVLLCFFALLQGMIFKFELLALERFAFVSAFNGIIVVFLQGIVLGISSLPIFCRLFCTSLLRLT